MTKIKLFVGLKIPDTTAITAFHTLEKLGYKQLKKLERKEYYEFIVPYDEGRFMKEIIKVDVLVNANKHSASIYKAEEVPKDDESVNVIVKDSGKSSSGLLSLLKERLGFDNVAEMHKGVLWAMYIDAPEQERKRIAEKITNDLLYNEHYQEYEFL